MYNYSVLPGNLQSGMKLYVEHGIKPGSFLTACIANDFIGALGCASTQTFEYLHRVAGFLYNEMPGRGPGAIWGTYEAVDAHCERKQGVR